MTAIIRHRGPDGDGVWTDSEAGVALGHRRLAILDLSPAGHQPMISPSGRYVLVFNGEIYNHLALRQMLPAANWRGHSDTETLLCSFEQWGFEATLKRSVGMFAIALWDRMERALYLARDRFGEKPLYYGWQRGIFLFGSELKSLEQHPAFVNEIDRNAITLQLRHNYIPAPFSIYRGISKLEPGTWLRVTANSVSAMPEPSRYWSMHETVEQGLAHPFAGTDEEAIQLVDSSLREAVAAQMVADVPLGAFLSGGIDSSTIVALMQAQSQQPVRTFSIGFNEAGFDEAQHAKAVAAHLGTCHTELYVTPQQALNVVEKLPFIYDEPFSDSSQIPTFLVAQMTQRHVAVSLSGDAGDEVFGGYNRYLFAPSLWKKIRWMPANVRHGLARLLGAVSPAQWDAFFTGIRPLLPKGLRFAQPGDKLHKLLGVLDVASPELLYYALVSHWVSPVDVVLDALEPPTCVTDRARWPAVDSLEHWMMAIDAISYLPDDILVKVDRAAMGVSLETRVPFLDHRVVELAWRLPLHMKVRDGSGKWILRQVLYRYVPAALIERPKMGFAVPLDSWLRGPLREWAESLLDEKRLKQDGFFAPAPIRQKWLEHLSGRRNWQYLLWDVLMFQAWWQVRCS